MSKINTTAFLELFFYIGSMHVEKREIVASNWALEERFFIEFLLKILLIRTFQQTNSPV